jgi:hypothetical protein
MNIPSFDQAAAKAAKRHTARIRSTFDLMVVMLRENPRGTGRPASDRMCGRESSSAVNRWRN